VEKKETAKIKLNMCVSKMSGEYLRITILKNCVRLKMRVPSKSRVLVRTKVWTRRKGAHIGANKSVNENHCCLFADANKSIHGTGTKYLCRVYT